ncbi:oxidoreductase [Clostridia bacterium]|nr:oxidoreductase [Clostridia bacterium]
MINVAIIGVGNISNQHCAAYLTFPERCKITHLVDIYPEKAVKRDADLNLGAAVFDSHKKILDDPAIDLVSICTPPYCHAEIAIDFLNAGKHVLMEKPMGTSLEECDAIIAAAEKSGKVLSPVAQNRFLDPIMNLKAVLDSGKIGRIVHAQVDSHWWRGHPYYDIWWRGTWEKEGGGCTLNHAVHHIDMLGWMMGLPESVSAVISNAAHDNSEVEDVSVAALKYSGGAVAQVTSSVIHHGERQQVVFQGERARVSAPWEVYASVTKPNGFPAEDMELETELKTYYEALPSMTYTVHTGQIDNVLTAIETGSDYLIRGADGRRTLELITAIYKAGATQRAVKLPIQRDDPFYTASGIMANVPHFYEKTASVLEQGGAITTGGNF